MTRIDPGVVLRPKELITPEQAAEPARLDTRLARSEIVPPACSAARSRPRGCFSPRNCPRLINSKLACCPRAVEINRLVCAGFIVIGFTKTRFGSCSLCSAENDAGSPTTTELIGSCMRMAVAYRGARYTTVTRPSLIALANTCGCRHGSVKDTQGQMRHADPTTTLRYYVKVIPEDQHKAVAGFERSVMKKLGKRRSKAEPDAN
jgi:hypothetical protein